MDKSLWLGGGIALAVIAASFFILFFQKNPYTKIPDKLAVVCTTSIIADAVRIITGDHSTITTLMGPGVDPHTYRAREHVVHALACADVIIYNGLHLEGKLTDILASISPYTTTIAATDALDDSDLITSSEFENVYDPHIWFDVQLWKKIVSYLNTQLQSIDPEHAHEYERNTQRYMQELQNLHNYVLMKANTLTPDQRILVTAHDAFHYFGRAYDFKVIGLQGISTDSEVSLQDIQKLITYIIDHRIPAIFIESSIPRRTIQAVHEALSAHNWHITVEPELYSDALGCPDTQAGTYIGMISYNINAIVGALKQGFDH